MTKFYVIDAEGHVSWFVNDEKPSDDGPENFDTEDDAIKRARDMAHSCPGDVITVCRAIKLVHCPVGESDVEDA